MRNMISATVITRNEADNIENCLRTLDWVDEIIVVDQFSTDETAQIAKGFGAQVFEERWKGFAQQKNSAIEKASGRWILSIDADERLTPQLRQEIVEVVSLETNINGYYIARRNYFCGRWIRHGGWYPDYNLRLFRKGFGEFQERTVHEKVMVEGAVGYLKNALEHYTYSSVSEYIVRMEKYSRLAAMQIHQENRWSRWHNLSLRPIFTFLNMYLLRMGFLDGSKGFFLAVSYAYYTFLKYYRFYEKDFDSQIPTQPTFQDRTKQNG